jgi:hypothetical protein
VLDRIASIADWLPISTDWSSRALSGNCALGRGGAHIRQPRRADNARHRRGARGGRLTAGLGDFKLAWAWPMNYRRPDPSHLMNNIN